ncbi:IS110 family transposase [Saccharopolyspora sp. NPDC003752]
MAVKVGIDVAKEFHWVAIVVAESGKVFASQRIDNDPDSIDALIGQLRHAEAPTTASSLSRSI